MNMTYLFKYHNSTKKSIKYAFFLSFKKAEIIMEESIEQSARNVEIFLVMSWLKI